MLAILKLLFTRVGSSNMNKRGFLYVPSAGGGGGGTPGGADTQV